MYDVDVLTICVCKMFSATEILKLIDESTWLLVAVIVIVLSMMKHAHRRTRCAMIANSLQADVVRLIALALPGRYALWAVTALAAQLVLLLGCVVVLRGRIWVYVLQGALLASYAAGTSIVSVKKLITVEQAFMGMLAGVALGASGIWLTSYCMVVLQRQQRRQCCGVGKIPPY